MPSTRHPLVQSSFQCLHLQPNTAVCCFFGSRFPDLVCTRMPDPRCRISDLAQTGCHYLHFHIWPASQPFPKLTKFSIFTIYFRSKVTFEKWSTQKPIYSIAEELTIILVSKFRTSQSYHWWYQAKGDWFFKAKYIWPLPYLIVCCQIKSAQRWT